MKNIFLNSTLHTLNKYVVLACTVCVKALEILVVIDMYGLLSLTTGKAGFMVSMGNVILLLSRYNHKLVTKRESATPPKLHKLPGYF